ncbi:MAG: MFS transporter [Oscillospiraceae bacterium]|nr:MFS transporter [Oscillospiraceae bacterium]
MKVSQRNKLDYKWIVAVLCFLVMFVGLGFCSSAKNAYFQPVAEALGFSRGAFGLSDTFRYATTAITTMFFHRLVNRFGTKKLMCAGLVFYAMSMLINSVSNTLVGFYIGGIFLGLGVAFAASTMASVIINKWFDKNKGTVLGIILAANAAGSAVAILMLEPLIYSDGLGYKNAYFITAVAVVIVLAIMLIFYKDKEGDVVSGSPKQEEKQKDAEWEGFEYEVLSRKPAYYIVIISLALYALMSVSPISTPHYKDIGFTGEFIALSLSIGSIGLAVSKIVVGIIYDRFGIKPAVNLCLFTALAAKLILFLITPELKALAICYTVLISIATPLETVMISIIVLDLFGKKSFNQALAITTSLFTIGHALNAPLLNLPYDFMGNYTISFVVSTVASVVIIFALNLSIISLKRDAKKETSMR